MPDMYTFTNFKTKKELKQAVADGKQVTIYQPNDIFGNPAARPDYTGNVSLEGPHYPQPHRWYASAKVVNGVIVKVSLIVALLLVGQSAFAILRPPYPVKTSPPDRGEIIIIVSERK